MNIGICLIQALPIQAVGLVYQAAYVNIFNRPALLEGRVKGLSSGRLQNGLMGTGLQFLLRHIIAKRLNPIQMSP